jgi:hypothetical protein
MRLTGPSPARNLRTSGATRARPVALFALIVLLSLAGCTSHLPPAAPVTSALRTPAATRQQSWVRRTYYGAGLAVTLTQPAQWTPRLAPQGFHYGATLAYLANFALRPYCRSTPVTVTCDPRRVGAYPADGVLVTLNVVGFGPGPIPQSQLLAAGSPVLIGGRRAVSRPLDVASCLGRGAGHAVRYTIDDGQAAGALQLTICWRGRSPLLAQEVKDTVQSLRIAADPRHRGPHPD